MDRGGYEKKKKSHRKMKNLLNEIGEWHVIRSGRYS
ncbi:hypothetical protein GcM1_187009 [Golovinomyces cichoracearum]|uniref:Uncharacterized protein n=1 Tax=Golovinomyces cichoracearum TaxID=62708 RepID=A0A420J2K4_9PEZI|nr:hypothetical protein GcM1_187009 [Golovinomyces cichoracearum]